MSLLRQPDSLGSDELAANPAAASIAFTNPSPAAGTTATASNGTDSAGSAGSSAIATGGGCPMGFTSSATAAAAAAGGIRPKRGKDPVHYHHYLQLDKVLGAQAPKSLETDGVLAHDEMLFIVIHQTYELWFKQIIHELDSARVLFSAPKVDEKNMLTIVLRLHRIVEILKLLVSQLRILETMTPLSFLDFREYLFPASGFQSFQFRQIENKLGLTRQRRMKYAREEYDAALQADQRAAIKQQEVNEPSLFELIDRWLARTPFLKTSDGWDFWSAYQASVKAMFEKDRNDIKNDREDLAKARLVDIAHTEKIFADFFDPAKYAEYVSQGRMRLSYASAQAALMINTFQEEPIFQVPFQILTSLLDIDELMTNWRHAHAQMVFRMLGVKIGTGGSSGYHYLKATASQHKIFEDFSNLSMFLIPRYYAPAMPKALTDKIRFNYEHPAFQLFDLSKPSGSPQKDAKASDEAPKASLTTGTAAATATAVAAAINGAPATPVKQAPAGGAAAATAAPSPTPLMVCPVKHGAATNKTSTA